MKYAIVPEAIVCHHPEAPPPNHTFPPFSFREYTEKCWLDDKGWLTPNSNLLALLKVMDQVKKDEGDVMCFEDADYAVLKGIILNPEQAPNGGPVRTLRPTIEVQLLGFKDAILNATDHDPRVPVNASPKVKQKALKALKKSDEETDSDETEVSN
jgi:hypothetical protein